MLQIKKLFVHELYGILLIEEKFLNKENKQKTNIFLFKLVSLFEVECIDHGLITFSNILDVKKVNLIRKLYVILVHIYINKEREDVAQKMWSALLIIIVLSITNGQQLNRNKFEISNDFLQRIYCGLSSRPQVKVSGEVGVKLEKVQTLVSQGENRYARWIEITSMPHAFSAPSGSIVDLFFPSTSYGSKPLILDMVRAHKLDMSRFSLECLNLSSNSLHDHFLVGYSPHSDELNTNENVLNQLIKAYFARLRLFQLTSNSFEHLSRHNFEIYETAPLEVLLLDYNKISSLRHDTFAGLTSLKYVGLNNNRIKLIHPLTFSSTPNLVYLNMAYNKLQAVFRTPGNQTIPNMLPFKSLKYFYLNGKC